ncbi:MAG: hypothetical protein FWD19_00730, partial [Defluviitaleaceae bacterium]|nr:hypothetical protein [Defluviitaleaceae bacterium]
MRIGVVGLGLIGGSIAKAYKRTPGIKIFGSDSDKSILEFAKLAEAIDGELLDVELKNCEARYENRSCRARLNRRLHREGVQTYAGNKSFRERLGQVDLRIRKARRSNR